MCVVSTYLWLPSVQPWRGTHHQQYSAGAAGSQNCGWGRCFSFSVGCWYFCRWTSLFSFGGVCTFPPLLITYILLCSWVSLPSKTYHMMAGLPCGFFKMSPLKASFTTTFSCVPFKRRATRTLPIALPWHFSHKWKSWEAPNLRSFEVVEIYFWKRFVVEICES